MSLLKFNISIETNEELKELLNEIIIEKSDPSAIEDICKEFLEFGMELPEFTRGFGQLIPINKSDTNPIREKFDKLKILYMRANCIDSDWSIL